MNTVTVHQDISIKKGFSQIKNEEDAVKDIFDQINQQEASAVVLFCSSKYDLARLGKAIKSTFDHPVIGCTTSGEISPEGYAEKSITGFSLASERLKVDTHVITSLTDGGAAQIPEMAKKVKAHLAEVRGEWSGAEAFGLLLIDGLSVMEEHIVTGIYNQLNSIPLIGGSAGDDLSFQKTYIYHNSEFITNAAVYNLFITTLPFKTFKLQHFVPTDKKFVVTEANPTRRTIGEIDGEQAAKRYAQLVGCRVDELDPVIFSKHPVMLKIGGEYFVRSIQKVNTDGSITFFCAIDEGIVLTLGECGDLVANLEDSLGSISQELQNPEIIIGCECILRRLEVIEKNLVMEVDELMKKHNVIGFHSYGEQYDSIHVNQTFTGVAIGR